MLSPTNIFQRREHFKVIYHGRSIYFISKWAVGLARAGAGRRFHLVPIVKISSESYYPDFWLGLEPGPVCRYLADTVQTPDHKYFPVK